MDGDAFNTEPWVLLDVEVKNDTGCHCIYEHERCLNLVEKRGSCLCRQFILVMSTLLERVDEQTWGDALFEKLGGISYSLCGCITYLETRGCYVYVTVLRVQSLEEGNRIAQLIDDNCWIRMRSEEPSGDYDSCVSYKKACCLEGFFRLYFLWQQKKDACNIPFGDVDLYLDLVRLHLDLFQLGYV